MLTDRQILQAARDMLVVLQAQMADEFFERVAIVRREWSDDRHSHETIGDEIWIGDVAARLGRLFRSGGGGDFDTVAREAVVGPPWEDAGAAELHEFADEIRREQDGSSGANTTGNVHPAIAAANAHRANHTRGRSR